MPNYIASLYAVALAFHLWNISNLKEGITKC